MSLNMNDLRNDLEDRKKETRETKMGGMTKNQYVRHVREQKRTEELDRLTPKRKCCLCRLVRLSNRSWVIISAYHRGILTILKENPDFKPEAESVLEAGCLCRSCAQREFEGKLWSIKKILGR